MSLLTYLVALCLLGLFVGAFARLALPGRDPMSIPATIAIGIGGTFVAGTIMALLEIRNGLGLLISVACAAGIVYLVRRSRGGGLTDPGAPR